MQTLISNPESVLVDVRSSWEYEAEHLNNAKNVLLEDLIFHIEAFKAMKGPIILYCRSGSRSGMAVKLLQQAGIKNTYNGGSIYDLKNLMLN